LDPDKLLVRKDQDRVQEAGKYRERNTPGDRATRDEGTSDGATRTAQSNALARMCRPAANRNRVRRNAKKGGSLRVAALFIATIWLVSSFLKSVAHSKIYVSVTRVLIRSETSFSNFQHVN
jgi:hypothetical protein